MTSASDDQAVAKTELQNGSSSQPGQSESAEDLTRLVQRPTVRGALTISEFSRDWADELDLGALVDTLRQQTDAAGAGSWRHVEATLVSQASALDAIFNNLAQRAANAKSPDAMDRFLRLALKAQGQCRATLETLARLKNPMAGAYVRQANIASGHQQVNNGHGIDVSRAREKLGEKTQLLEQAHDKRVDPGAARSAGGADPQLEPLGQIHGP